MTDRPAPPAVRARPRWARFAPFVLAGLSVVVAAAVLVAQRPSNPFGAQQTRAIEPRLSHPALRAHAPLQPPADPSNAPTVSLATLASFEERRDLTGLAAGLLLRGEKDRALDALSRAPASAEVDSDRAAVALLKDQPEEALRAATAALGTAPAHPRALWNKALALRDLGLTLAAAEAFAQVAAQGEPGWSAEAKGRAETLRAATEAGHASYDQDWKAGAEMIAGGPLLTEAAVRAHPGLARLVFYDAVRAAPDKARALLLLPLAKRLDEETGRHLLEEHVRRVSQLDFAVRGPLARRYALVPGRQLDAAGTEALLAGLFAAPAGQVDDLALGTIALTQPLPAHVERYDAMAAASQPGDPWFAAIVAQKQAAAEIARGEHFKAELRLQAALQACRTARVDYRCALVQLALADLYATLSRFAEARVHGREAIEKVRAAREWYLELRALQGQAQLARLRFDFPLARSLLREVSLRQPGACGPQNLVAETLADLSLFELKFAQARAELEQGPPCPGDLLTLYGLMQLADLARLAPRPDDVPRGRAALSALRSSSTLSQGELALADHIEGRLLLPRDPEAGRRLLRSSIEAADRLPGDENARKGRAYSFSLLLLDAGGRGAFGEAMSLFAGEERVPPPSSCAMGATVEDDRSLLVVRGARGEDVGAFDGARTAPALQYVPALNGPQRAALEGCASVSVLARPPLHGRAALLPAELAWSYRVGNQAKAAPVPGERRLVVSDVEPPESLGLPRLSSWSTDPGEGLPAVELKGAQATPARVLAEMRDASEIEIHAHGLVDLGLSDVSLIALTPAVDGAYALTAGEVKKAKLSRSPLVLLAACRAAQQGTSLHAPWSLPVAFLEAGARAVLASRADIPDAQARGFFDGVLQRIRAGVAPSVAVRDERLAWRTRPGGLWVDQVLVFE